MLEDKDASECKNNQKACNDVDIFPEFLAGYP